MRPTSPTHSTANDADGDSSHDGKKVFLQYNGPGDLWGIPMEGVSFDGQGGGKDRFYPIFSIADGVLLGPGGNDFVIKAIEKEQQLRPVNFVECAGLLLPAPNALPLPDVADYEPPGIGDPPVITAPPAVIQGVVQK